MFGLGFTELLLILVVALVVFGPQKLPEIARTLGKTMGELRRTMDEIRYDVSSMDYDAPRNTPTNPSGAEDSPAVDPLKPIPEPPKPESLAGTCEEARTEPKQSDLEKISGEE